MALSLQGPLLESVHTDVDIQANFREQLTAYRKEAGAELGELRMENAACAGLGGLAELSLRVFGIDPKIAGAELT